MTERHRLLATAKKHGRDATPIIVVQRGEDRARELSRDFRAKDSATTSDGSGIVRGATGYHGDDTRATRSSRAAASGEQEPAHHALVSGRRLFDLTDGWGDNHPAGALVVVVTHHPPDDAATRWPRAAFVGRVDAAVVKAREIAGDDDVTIMSPNVIQQALDLGLVDEVCVSLVPVLFGEGISYFGPLQHGHLLLEDPVVHQGRRALQLRYPVRRS